MKIIRVDAMQGRIQQVTDSKNNSKTPADLQLAQKVQWNRSQPKDQ
jgi:hypothetical protein